MSNEKQIEIKNLSFIYDSNLKFLPKAITNSEDLSLKDVKDIEFDSSLKALDDINISINKGDFIGLIGNTGSGKSSLVRTLNGLIPKFYNGLFFGYVHVADKDTIDYDIPDLSMDVGMMFQNPENQLIAMNVEREIAMGLENRGVNREETIKKVNEVISYMNIEHLRYRHPYELSGGEQQKVAIASILAIEPEVLVLDEPTSALDPVTARDIMKLIQKMQKDKGLTVIIIEHRLQMILDYCDKLMIMQNGKIIAFDETQKIMNEKTIYEIGIEVPQFCNLFQKLRDDGIYSGNIPVTIESASEKLMEMFKS